MTNTTANVEIERPCNDRCLFLEEAWRFDDPSIHVSSSAVSNLLPLNVRKIRPSILIARFVPKVANNFCQYIKEHKRFEFAILNFSQTDTRASKRSSKHLR